MVWLLRMRLPKKGNKDKKKLISQEIKKLVADLREKHDRELEEAGTWRVGGTYHMMHFI